MMELGLGLGVTQPGGFSASSVLGGPGGIGSSGPSYPVVPNSRLLLWDGEGITEDEGSISSWQSVGGDWSSDVATQATSSRQPLITPDGIQCDGIDDALELTDPITISGDFALYVVMSRSADEQIVIWTGDEDDKTIVNYVGSTFYYYASGGAFAVSPDTWSGLQIMRLRRSGSTMYYKRPGVSEVSNTRPESLTWARLFARGAESSNSDVRHRAYAYVERNLTPGDADDIAITNWFLSKYPTAAW